MYDCIMAVILEKTMLVLSCVPQERVMRLFRTNHAAADSSISHTTRAALRVLEVSKKMSRRVSFGE